MLVVATGDAGDAVVASVTSPVTGTPLVISLANGQSITIPVNSSSGSVDFIAPNNVLNTNTPLTNSITGVTCRCCR
ncbi:immunoglobulin-like domain-containing protein [Pseudomonas ulcerans]|uniref:immunoglobulin-like domain-containing protein n=1 Tax=Pseudomonas ulcerans TaxID=3115852 RepID=UPI0035CD1F70